MEKMESLGFNSNSKILLSVIIGLQLVALLRRKESSIHPLILAQQSEPSSVRHENQSAIYRNTTIGSFPLVERPAAKARSIANLLELSPQDSKITIQDHSFTIRELLLKSLSYISFIYNQNVNLKDENSTILIASDNIYSCILIEIGATLTGVRTAHISSKNSLSKAIHALENEKDAQVKAIIADSALNDLPHHKIGVLCAFTKTIPPNFGLNFVKLEMNAVDDILKQERNPTSIHSYVFGKDNNIYSVNHCNVTAGVYTILACIPFAKKPQSSDIFMTDEPLTTAFGRSLLYAAIFSGCTYQNISQVPDNTLPLSTVPQYLFTSSKRLVPFAESITKAASKKFFYNICRRNALADDAAGALNEPSNYGLYKRARDEIGVSNFMKYIVITDDDISDEVIVNLRIALSVPVVRSSKHERVSAMVFSRIAYDLQLNGGQGPPTHTIEARLDKGENEFCGRLMIKGPAVIDSKEFIDTNENWKILTNGSFCKS